MPSDGGLVVLRHPDVPPSLNAVRARNHWTYTREKKKWGLLFDQLLAAATARGELPARVARVKARAIVTYHVNRLPDEGNVRYMLEKALGDALDGGQHTYTVPVWDEKKQKVVNSRRKSFPDGRWLAEDEADRYRFASVHVTYEPLPPPPPGMPKSTWRAVHPRGHTEIRLRYWLAL